MKMKRFCMLLEEDLAVYMALTRDGLVYHPCGLVDNERSCLLGHTHNTIQHDKRHLDMGAVFVTAGQEALCFLSFYFSSSLPIHEYRIC